MFLSACVLAMLPATGPDRAVVSVAPAANGQWLFVVTRDAGGVWLGVWNLSKPELTAVVTGLPANTHSVHPTADGNRFTLVAGNHANATQLEVWDTATRKRRHEFDTRVKYGGAVTVSPDGNWVAFRPYRDDSAPRVWNTDTGQRADAVEKAVGKVDGVFTFTTDSKRLVVLAAGGYAEYDLATGKIGKSWKPNKPNRTYLESEFGQWVAVLPDGKGAVTVAATGKRRQSYVVHLRTEKENGFLGEVWDTATAPVLSPDGRLLIVSAGQPRGEGGTFVLKLGADGVPEMADPKEAEKGPFWGRGFGEKLPAWREWALGEATRAGREVPAALAFTPDGQRLFVAGRLGRLSVHDPQRRVLTATLFAAAPAKDEVPDWHILTAAGEFVGSPVEAEALAKSGKVKDVAKVKEALGVK